MFVGRIPDDGMVGRTAETGIRFDCRSVPIFLFCFFRIVFSSLVVVVLVHICELEDRFIVEAFPASSLSLGGGH